MLDQTSHDQFKPDWDAMEIMVEEQQRMAKRIAELEALLERQTALLERQTARIVELQEHIENFDGEDR
jgi:predicted  nucleic acid-binding Zn-ribbon protein